MTKTNSKKKRTRNNKPQQNTSANVTALGKALRALGTIGGSAAGSYIGSPAAGAAIGTNLGAAISKWMGAGDYSLSNNSIVSKASTSVPDMHKSNQTVTVRHREFIATIRGSTNFTIQETFQINPGLSPLFPWLSTIATSFQEYKIKGMVYHYIPTSGAAVSSTNAALGSVMIQTSYRANDTPPVNKSEMLNEFWANETVPSETLAHPIECDPKENPFAIHYVRSEPIPDGDVLLYDMGKTFVATQGMQAVNDIGDLWVTYEIEFRKPIVRSNVTPEAYYYSSVRSGGNGLTAYFGVVITEAGTLDVTLTGRTISFINERPGKYLITFALEGTFGGAVSYTGAASFTNCSSYLFDGQSAALFGSIVEATSVVNNQYTLGLVISEPNVTASVLLPVATATSGTLQGTSVQIVYIGPGTAF